MKRMRLDVNGDDHVAGEALVAAVEERGYGAAARG